jgi:hypothetical protein
MIPDDTLTNNGTTFRFGCVRRSHAAILDDIKACSERLDALKAELFVARSPCTAAGVGWHRPASETSDAQWNVGRYQ